MMTLTQRIDFELDLITQWCIIESARAEIHKKRVLALVDGLAVLRADVYAGRACGDALDDLIRERRAVGVLLLGLRSAA